MESLSARTIPDANHPTSAGEGIWDGRLVLNQSMRFDERPLPLVANVRIEPEPASDYESSIR